MDVSRFVARERDRAAAVAKTRSVLAGELRARLPTLVEGLVARGATRVVLFGSLASGTLDEASDVDVAVRGIKPVVLHAVASWAELTMRRPVDVVRIEEAPAALLARIDEGETLHDG